MRVMNEEADARAEGEVGRGRPLSGGLWTLFSWLRRDDSSSSSDSLSSAGSDRTAVSFAFVAAPPPRARAAPLPHPDPPTNSYRRRVRDRHSQREHDRDLTLHRKYGLYYGYDAFSLPPQPKRFTDTNDEQSRDRRATSESLPRRAAHVPGKRRAPQPPARPHSVVSTASLTRRYNRKRPAPQPPIKLIEKSKENIPVLHLDKISDEMNSKSNSEVKPLSEANNSNGCKLEKYSKKNSKDTKLRTEKSFLKQIFENRKRNSTLEPVPERILPSISELDKQAAEIIELCRLKPLEQNINLSEASSSQKQTWFCTRCLRKYDSTTVTCQYCLPEQKRLSTEKGLDSVSSSSSTAYTQTEKKSLSDVTPSRASVTEDEKQKLKEMLKEMKKSLPKKSKHESENIFKFESQTNTTTSSLETPTLRIGSHVQKEENDNLIQHPTAKQVERAKPKIASISNVEKVLPKIGPEPLSQNVVITQHVVLMGPPTRITVNKLEDKSIVTTNSITVERNKQYPETSNSNSAIDLTKSKLHTPLKISSLLNPVYIPKSAPLNQESSRSRFVSQVESNTSTSAAAGCLFNLDKAGPAELNDDNKIKERNGESLAKSPDTKQGDETMSKSITQEEKPAESRNSKLGNKITSKTGEREQKPILSASSKSTVSSELASTSNNDPEKTKLKQSNMVRFNVEQHSRRRELINQLEQSIAKGDERAAADAATKLAQLRLSCSVLSFTSQIMADNKTEIPEQQEAPKRIVEDVKPKATKIDIAVQLSEATTSNASKTKNVPKAAEIIGGISSMSPPSKQENIQKPKLNEPSTSTTTIQVWVEDREATRGPVSLRISRHAAMGELRQQAETSLGLAGALQRWIVGRTLCTDDRTQLATLAGPDLTAPFYLCVVESENINNRKKAVVTTSETKTVTEPDKTVSDVYSELVLLEQHAFVRNAEPFECNVCMEECATGAGATLRECVHSFCKECLADLVRHCEEPIVSCPAMGCPGVLQEREVRALVTPEEYERWLTRGLAAAESGNRNAFHCRTRDCTGWAFCDPGVRRFPCPVCKHTNCIPCQAIHEGVTCNQYQVKLREAITPTTQTDEGTETLLNTLIEKGEALKCPECNAIITKKWGCDWVKCSACKTEICWVTRGRRWGPGGKGDTSGGCRCGVDGKRCHPSCAYCH